MSGDLAERDLAPLWEPLRIGSITVDNRIFVSAHETNHGDRRLLGDRYVEYVAARARGGAGLVMPGGASVHPQGEHVGHLPVWWEQCIPGYSRLAERVHEEGSKVFVQLYHRGIQGSGADSLGNRHPVPGPSAIASAVYRRVAKPLATDEIAEIVDHYAVSAANLREAGVDGLEVGAAHGYLLCQFLSPLTNRRTDEYGGSLENRARFLREVLEAVRGRVGPEFPLGIRISFDEFVGEAGITPDLAERLVEYVSGWGLLDFISVSGANYHSLQFLIPSMSAEKGAHFAENAARARRAVAGEIPIFVASGVRTVEQAAAVLREGQADLVGMTRAHIADPSLVSKARAGRGTEIRRCVGANQGCVRRVGMKNAMGCTVNPVVGHEHDWELRSQAVTPQRVIVVGGGPGGMKAAETAQLRGHEVTLIERGPALGGQLLHASQLATRARWKDLVEDLEAGLSTAGVEVWTETEATAEQLLEADADAIILATGSSLDRSGFSMNLPHRAGIPGAELDHVIDVVEAIERPDAVGSRVLIVDDIGDTIASSLAIGLAESGREVEVVTAGLHAAGATVLTADLPWLMPRMLAAGVRTAAQVYLGEIRPGQVTIESVWGSEPARTAAADTVVLCMLRKSETELYEDLVNAGHSPQRVGDCLAPREVDEAIYEGMAAALAIGASSPQDA